VNLQVKVDKVTISSALCLKHLLLLRRILLGKKCAVLCGLVITARTLCNTLNKEIVSLQFHVLSDCTGARLLFLAIGAISYVLSTYCCFYATKTSPFGILYVSEPRAANESIWNSRVKQTQQVKSAWTRSCYSLIKFCFAQIGMSLLMK